MKNYRLKKEAVPFFKEKGIPGHHRDAGTGQGNRQDGAMICQICYRQSDGADFTTDIFNGEKEDFLFCDGCWRDGSVTKVPKKNVKTSSQGILDN